MPEGRADLIALLQAIDGRLDDALLGVEGLVLDLDRPDRILRRRLINGREKNFDRASVEGFSLNGLDAFFAFGARLP